MDKKRKKLGCQIFFAALKLDAYISFSSKIENKMGQKVFKQNKGRFYQILVGKRLIIDYKKLALFQLYTYSYEV